MSRWTHISADIKIGGVKKEFIKMAYNLPKNISEEEYDGFVNNYKNFTYYFGNDFTTTYLVKDYTEKIKDFLNNTTILTGSEGPCEVILGDYPKLRKNWGVGCMWSATRMWNTKTERLVSEMFKEEYDDKDVEYIDETSRGDNSHILLYGSMRDRIYKDSEQELIIFLKTLFKYFVIDDIHIILGDDSTEAIISSYLTSARCRSEEIMIKRTITTWDTSGEKWKKKVSHNHEIVEIGKY